MTTTTFPTLHEISLAEFTGEGHQYREMKLLPLFQGAWIAGGSLRSFVDRTEIKDIDVFFCDCVAFEVFCDAMESDGWETETETPYATTYSKPGRIVVQAVRFAYFKSVEDIFEGFDLTCCQFATDGTTVWHTPEASIDAANKVLRPGPTIDRGYATFHRCMRLAARGYSLPSGKDTRADNIDLLERMSATSNQGGEGS